ncbi:MAG: hypothetical protein D6717_10005 [Gammaproteobacteria bacterium]|nr:MAG: hypothetical protein D6717_10005 [Gammaproteobacteria bacterium]
MGIQEDTLTQPRLSKAQERIERFAFDLLRQWPELSTGDEAAQQRIGEAIADLRRYLARTAVFRTLLKRLREAPPPAEGWSWHTLLDSEQITAGLLHMAGNATMPYHDHPGALDALLVIDGEVEVRSYSPTSNVLALSQRAAHLRPVDYRRLMEDQASIAFPAHGNIHGLRCFGDRAILLDVQVKPTGEKTERRWYFPLGASSQDPGHIIAAAVPESLLRSAVGCPATD